MTVVNMESLILNFWLSFANKIRDGVAKKPTICEHGVFSLTFLYPPVYVCSMFQDGKKHCSHCVTVMNGSLECKDKVTMCHTRSFANSGAFRSQLGRRNQ